VVKGYPSTQLGRNHSRTCYVTVIRIRKAQRNHAFFLSSFEYVIPLSAKKHGAHLINSESKKRNVERNQRWMECSNSQKLEVQSMQGKVSSCGIKCESYAQWKSDGCKRCPFQGYGKCVC